MDGSHFRCTPSLSFPQALTQHRWIKEEKTQFNMNPPQHNKQFGVICTHYLPTCQLGHFMYNTYVFPL